MFKETGGEGGFTPEKTEVKKEGTLLDHIEEWVDKAKSVDKDQFREIKPKESTLKFAEYLAEEAKKRGGSSSSPEDIARGFELLDKQMMKLIKEDMDKDDMFDYEDEGTNED